MRCHLRAARVRLATAGLAFAWLRNLSVPPFSRRSSPPRDGEACPCANDARVCHLRAARVRLATRARLRRRAFCTGGATFAPLESASRPHGAVTAYEEPPVPPSRRSSPPRDQSRESRTNPRSSMPLCERLAEAHHAPPRSIGICWALVFGGLRLSRELPFEQCVGTRASPGFWVARSKLQASRLERTRAVPLPGPRELGSFLRSVRVALRTLARSANGSPLPVAVVRRANSPAFGRRVPAPAWIARRRPWFTLAPPPLPSSGCAQRASGPAAARPPTSAARRAFARVLP